MRMIQLSMKIPQLRERKKEEEKKVKKMLIAQI